METIALSSVAASALPPIRPQPRAILRQKAVETLTGRSRSSIWRDVRTGSFPKPVRIGQRAIGWFADEIDAYIAALPRAIGKLRPI